MHPIHLLILISHATASLLQALDVPQFSLSGRRATLRCVYDMSNTKLYSLKWYHNNTEFYRYVPTERNGPVNIGPTDIFMLHEVSRDDHQVTLSLAKLKPSATGTYKCEVLADHPSFRTESAQAFMKILDSRFEAPEIRGLKDVYDPDDFINIRCQPQRDTPPDLHPRLLWLVDGREMSLSSIEQFGQVTDGPLQGISLNFPAQQIVDSGGSIQIECRATLGPLESRAVKTLRVKMKDYFFSLSAATGEKLSPPLIKGVREVYETSDLITVGCEPTNALYAEPRPKINWLMDGRELPKRYLSQYGHTLDGRYKGISLHIPGQLVLEAGGSVQVECRLKLGPFEERSTRTLRAMMEHKSLASAPSEDGNGEQSKSGSSWNIPTAHLIFTYSLYIPLQSFRNVLR